MFVCIKDQIQNMNLVIGCTVGCDGANTQNVNCGNDLLTIGSMVENSKKAINIIAIPQNTQFNYYKSNRSYIYHSMLKDMLPDLTEHFLTVLIPQHGIVLSLLFENSRTVFGEHEYKGAFVFDHPSFCTVISRSKSEKISTIHLNNSNVFLTTLKISESTESLTNFVNSLFGGTRSEPMPNWVTGLRYFDDEKQVNIICTKQAEIEIAQAAIDEAKSRLLENLKYKSILYTNGEDLVEVIYEMLEKLLSCDLSQFVDKNKEDFLIRKESVTLIGEIKGVSTNVKNEHVAQVENHFQGYMDELAENGQDEHVRQILIINPLRNKPLPDREPVHENQIKLAERNGCLIIETATLLRLYEKFVAGEVDVSFCERLFSEKTGLLKESDFE